jgi:uncharacterized sporulation protein YeaH/YhbH (DUF444 family)
MISRIEQDQGRFRQIVKGTIRKDLRRFIARDEMIGQEGGRAVSIPVHDIDTPTFKYGDNSGQVGMGDGDGDGQGQGGKGKAGEAEGKHLMEVSVTIEELADILGEELKLPRIVPKGNHQITTQKDRYNGVRPTGPNSLRHFKRTYREALKRQVAMGAYDPANPVIVPIKNDLRFRSWTEVKEPHSNALAVYMMDVSGSMGSEQKELVRLQAFWIDSWLRRNYKGFESRFIVHDVNAQVVDRKTFFSLREDGGTKISSALVAAKELLKKNFDPSEWNTYLFHFSDGDNSSDTDNRLCVETLQKDLLPVINQFGYVQVKSAYGSGQFLSVLREAFPETADQSSAAAKVATAKVNEREDVLDALRALFMAGR